jgi:hypothetical protein
MDLPHWRNFPKIELGLLLVALVCAGFAPWRAEPGFPDRPLSESQKARLVRALRPIAPAVASVRLWSDGQPADVRYLVELAKLFELAGVRADVDDMHGRSGREQGVVIVVHDKDRPPGKGIALLRALRKGGLNPSFAQDPAGKDRSPDFAVAVLGPSRPEGVGSTETAALRRRSSSP